MKYFLLLLFLSACGSPPPVVVDPEFQSYFASFENDIGYSSAGVSAQFLDTENLPNPLGETVGECISYTDGSRLINIDPGFWNTADKTMRINIIYHELGHCALNLQHITTSQNNGCYTSIMYPDLFADRLLYPERAVLFSRTGFTWMN